MPVKFNAWVRLGDHNDFIIKCPRDLDAQVALSTAQKSNGCLNMTKRYHFVVPQFPHQRTGITIGWLLQVLFCHIQYTVVEPLVKVHNCAFIPVAFGAKPVLC